MRRDDFIAANLIPNVTMKDVEEMMKGYTFWPQQITALLACSPLFVMLVVEGAISICESIFFFVVFSVGFTYIMWMIWARNFEKAKQEKLKKWNENINRRNELARKSVEARNR